MSKTKKIQKIIRNIIGTTQKTVRRGLVRFVTLNFALVIFQTVYILVRYTYINTTIPFFYTKIWGDTQLAHKSNLFFIPLMGIAALFVGALLYYGSERFYLRFGSKIVANVISFSNLLLTVSLVRIVMVSSVPFEPIINPTYLSLAIPAFVGFTLTYFVSPYFIEKFTNIGIVTHPEMHNHPGMILQKPATRGGGFIFAICFLVTSYFFLGIPSQFVGIYIAAITLAVLGLIDDYQNTNTRSKLRILENPAIRLIILLAIVLIPTYLGIKIDFISNPINGILDFSQYRIIINGLSVPWISVGFTTLWIVWVLNVLSWSNGIDGQYGGIVGISLLVIAVLALRFDPIQENHIQIATLTAIGAGVAFGLTKYTWFPSKILWGFGAMAPGLVIATTSILVGGKIAVSVLIILIPFLDAVVTFTRRLLQKKNPLKGDKGHLHHLLMKRGWGQRRIATFYWLSTAIFGYIGFVSAERDALLVLLTLSGLVAFFIIFLNITSAFSGRNSKKTLEKYISKLK